MRMPFAPRTTDPAPSRYAPYAAEREALRQEMSDRMRRYNECDPADTAAIEACIYEVLAADRRMQSLVNMAQREMEIAHAESDLAALRAEYRALPIDADPIEMRLLDAQINDAFAWLDHVRTMPIQPLDPVDVRAHLLHHGSLRLRA